MLNSSLEIPAEVGRAPALHRTAPELCPLPRTMGTRHHGASWLCGHPLFPGRAAGERVSDASTRALPMSTVQSVVRAALPCPPQALCGGVGPVGGEAATKGFQAQAHPPTTRS